jgi:alkylated DNA nucleotide flippase Atl1
MPPRGGCGQPHPRARKWLATQRARPCLLRLCKRANRLAALTGADDVEEVETPTIRSTWGRKILRLPKLGLEDGMTTKEIASAIGHPDEANAHNVLVALVEQHLVEPVEGASPKRWRLTQKQRRDRILKSSRLIKDGYWVTYGDIAIAAFDNPRLARVVARVAAHNPAFSNPHRVLAKGGVIAEGWKDDDGNGPEECIRRLADDGVELVDGRAPEARRMHHDELKARLDALDIDGEDL